MVSPRASQRTVSDSHRLNKFKLSLAKRSPSNEDILSLQYQSKHRPTLIIPHSSIKRLHTQRTIRQPCNRQHHSTMRDKPSRQQKHPSNQEIQVILIIEQQRIEFKSRATTVKTLLEETKNALHNYTAKTHPLVFQTCNNDLALDYHLTCPNATTNFLFGQSLSLRPYPTSPNAIPLNHFQLKRPIGSGGFSRVFLSRDRSDGRFYALKVISKAFILKHRKQRLVRNERDIMVELPHPLLAKLQATFETKQFIVFVIDYYPGGQLFGVVKRFRRMDEAKARFYATEVLLGLERLHDAGVVYRDLKPENILLDREGHAHLADFGLAKPGLKNQHSRAYSFCGSAEYMPPEIVSKRGHTLPADFYSLGALLFELVTGLPPFYDRDPQKIYKATRCKRITVPDYVSESLANLLEGLLTKEEDKRLGARFGVREILAHPWFGKIDRTDFIEKRISPPISFLMPKDYHINGEEANAQNDSFADELTRQLADRGHFAPMFPNFFAYSRPSVSHSTERRHLLSRQLSKSKRRTLLSNYLSTGSLPKSNNYI